MSGAEKAEILLEKLKADSVEYKELETEGYVYSMKGKGTFASATDFIHKSREQELLMTFDDIVTELLVLKVSKEELGCRLENLNQGRLEKND